MVADIPYAEAVFLETWLEGAFYGMYLPLFAACVWVLLRRSPVNWPYFVAACAMFAFATAHVSLSLKQALVAFFTPNTDPSVVLSRLATPIDLAADALYLTSTLIGDSIVIYRVYIVWEKRLSVIVIPSLLVIAVSVLGALSVSAVTDNPLQPLKPNLILSSRFAFILTLCANVVSTGLIAGRLLYFARKFNRLLPRTAISYYDLIALVIESAALYPLALIAFLTLYGLNMSAQFVVLGALYQIIGIVPSLIIVRVGLGFTHSRSSNMTPSTLIIHGIRPTEGARTQPDQQELYERSPKRNSIHDDPSSMV